MSFHIVVVRNEKLLITSAGMKQLVASCKTVVHAVTIQTKGSYLFAQLN